MRFLVFGGRGWIGQMVVECLQKQNDTVFLAESRADDREAVIAELDRVKPHLVFASIGRTHGVTSDGKVYNTIDFLELPGNENINSRDNLIAPVTLALACAERDIHFTYLGTGCIFAYDETHQMPPNTNAAAALNCDTVVGFREDDLPNYFGSNYSRIKGITDQLMHRLPSVLNVRIRMPISAKRDARDFITKITSYQKICSLPNSMTVLPQLLPIMVHMMKSGVCGTYNLCNPGVMTHNQILDMYRTYVDNQFTYENFTEAEQAKILLSGRSNNYLNTEKLEKYCRKNNLPLQTLFDAVANLLQNSEP